ncbi:MAG: hypothetical protein ACFCU3_01495 [Verrucomicrobiales bacterium]
MLFEFITRSWRPYLAGLGSFSLILAVLFTIAGGGSGLNDLFFLTISILMVAAPVTFLIAMPIAFWAWRVQQQRGVQLSKAQATLIGFGVGALLHTIFLMLYGGWMALPQILGFTMLCGGGYGATYAYLFSLWGGLRLTTGEKAGNG